MKYDGTGWCKQTAAIEEGRHCSGSFTHWCAWRPGTKSLLMKALAEAQGVRGLGMVSISSTNQTATRHTMPCHAIPSQDFTPTHSAPFWLSSSTDVYFPCLCLLSTQTAVSGWFYRLDSSSTLTVYVRHYRLKLSGLSVGTGLSQTLALFEISILYFFSQKERVNELVRKEKTISAVLYQIVFCKFKCPKSIKLIAC